LGKSGPNFTAVSQGCHRGYRICRICPQGSAQLRHCCAPAPSLAPETPVTAGVAESSTCTTVISLPWSAPAFASVKGVVHQPEAKPTLKQETRDAILLAVVKARSWIDDIASGRVRSFAEIAEREGKVERHIRLLTPW
jgi:hypothetical protein